MAEPICHGPAWAGQYLPCSIVWAALGPGGPAWEAPYGQSCMEVFRWKAWSESREGRMGSEMRSSTSACWACSGRRAATGPGLIAWHACSSYACDPCLSKHACALQTTPEAMALRPTTVSLSFLSYDLWILCNYKEWATCCYSGAAHASRILQIDETELETWL